MQAGTPNNDSVSNSKPAADTTPKRAKFRQGFNLRRIMEESEYTYLLWTFFLPFGLLVAYLTALFVLRGVFVSKSATPTA